MSSTILGHGSTPLGANREAAAQFWSRGKGWVRGGASVRHDVAASSLSYRGNEIARVYEGGHLYLATRGYNTMTTRRYLAAVLERVGWSVVALNGRSVALEGSPQWPNKGELAKLEAAGKAVTIGDGFTRLPVEVAGL